MVAIIITVGCFGNILTILAIVKKRELQTIPNYYVMNLACADLAVCTFVAPITALLLAGVHIPDWLCKMTGFASLVFMMTSVLNLGIIGFNRYILICKSFHLYQRIFTTRNVLLSIIGIWIFVMIDVSPAFYGFGSYGFNKFFGTCLFNTDHKWNFFFVLIMLDTIIMFPCLTITLYFYIAIYRKFARTRKGIDSEMPSTAQTSASEDDIKLPSVINATIKQEKNHRVQYGLILYVYVFRVHQKTPDHISQVNSYTIEGPVFFGIIFPFFKDIFLTFLWKKYLMVINTVKTFCTKSVNIGKQCLLNNI